MWKLLNNVCHSGFISESYKRSIESNQEDAETNLSMAYKQSEIRNKANLLCD